MATSYRYDYIPVGSYQETPEGYLIIPARIARVGVQEYRRADGSVQREYRPPDEVGAQASLDSFKLRPVTLEHPPSLLNSDNVNDYSVGHIGEQISFDGEYVTANVAILRRDAVEKVKSGEIRELSCGYQVAWDPTPGRTDDGAHYDGCQRRILGNHVALTRKGRAGPEVRLLMDSDDDVAVAVQRLDECDCESCRMADECPCKNETPKKRKRKKMARLTIDGAEFEVDDAVAAAVAASQRADAAEKEALQHELEQLREDARKKAVMPEEDEEDMEGTEDDPDYASEDEEEEPAPKAARRKDKKASKCDSCIAEYEGRIDALYAYIDELGAQANDRMDSDEFNAAVDERVTLIRKAEQVLGSDYEWVGRSNREIMEDALGVTLDSADLSDRSDDYVAARFDAMLEMQQRSDSVRSLERAIAGSRTQGSSDYGSAYVQSLTEAWKNPLVAKKEAH